MLPFRVYDKKAKEMWIVLNYHPNNNSYLLAIEDDSEDDGRFKIVTAEDLSKFFLVDFLGSVEE